jgi:isocitrate dehydrogenase kinase/phosphatase
MTSLLILIKDNINNTYSLYDNKHEFGFKNCIDFLKKETSLEFKNVIIEDKLCELFIEKKNIQKGWVWNTDIIDTIKIYTLSFISIKNNNSTKESFTQTETIEMVDKEIQNPNHIFTKNSANQTNESSIALPYNPINYFKYEINEQFSSTCNKITNNFTTQIPTSFVQKDERDDQFIKSDDQDFIKKDKKCNNDYSLNDLLITELKQHLNTTNYGLRRRRRARYS